MSTQIDNYGLCLRNVKLAPAAKSIKEGANPNDAYSAKLDTLRAYKFTLVFENTIATDWVTEKVFHALAAGSLPVFWGAREVHRLLPCDNCIVHALDFASPLQLAKYLQFLLENPKEYLKYFEWKKKPHQLRTSFLEHWRYCQNNHNLAMSCMLCDRMIYMKQNNVCIPHAKNPSQFIHNTIMTDTEHQIYTRTLIHVFMHAHP